MQISVDSAQHSLYNSIIPSAQHSAQPKLISETYTMLNLFALIVSLVCLALAFLPVRTYARQTIAAFAVPVKTKATLLKEARQATMAYGRTLRALSLPSCFNFDSTRLMSAFNAQLAMQNAWQVYHNAI